MLESDTELNQFIYTERTKRHNLNAKQVELCLFKQRHLSVGDHGMCIGG